MQSALETGGVSFVDDKKAFGIMAALRLKFAPAIRGKLNLLNRLGRKSPPESVHVDIHKSANL
jgi:hypothetical protein